MTTRTAVYRLDDSDNPGEAIVKVIKQLVTAQAQAVKTFTGHDTYQVECVEVTKPSTFAANPKPGKRQNVSTKHLTFKS